MAEKIISSWYKDNEAVEKLKELAEKKVFYAQVDYSGICIENGKDIEKNYSFLKQAKMANVNAKEFAIFNLAVLSYENEDKKKACKYLKKTDWKLCPFALLMLIFIYLQQKENLSKKEAEDCKNYLLTFLNMYENRGMEGLRLTSSVIYLTQNAKLAKKLLFDFFGIKSDVKIKSKEISKKNRFARVNLFNETELREDGLSEEKIKESLCKENEINFRREVMENMWNSILKIWQNQ